MTEDQEMAELRADRDRWEKLAAKYRRERDSQEDRGDIARNTCDRLHARIGSLEQSLDDVSEDLEVANAYMMRYLDRARVAEEELKRTEEDRLRLEERLVEAQGSSPTHVELAEISQGVLALRQPSHQELQDELAATKEALAEARAIITNINLGAEQTAERRKRVEVQRQALSRDLAAVSDAARRFLANLDRRKTP